MRRLPSVIGAPDRLSLFASGRHPKCRSRPYAKPYISWAQDEQSGNGEQVGHHLEYCGYEYLQAQRLQGKAHSQGAPEWPRQPLVPISVGATGIEPSPLDQTPAEPADSSDKSLSEEG